MSTLVDPKTSNEKVLNLKDGAVINGSGKLSNGIDMNGVKNGVKRAVEQEEEPRNKLRKCEKRYDF